MTGLLSCVRIRYAVYQYICYLNVRTSRGERVIITLDTWDRWDWATDREIRHWLIDQSYRKRRENELMVQGKKQELNKKKGDHMVSSYILIEHPEVTTDKKSTKAFNGCAHCFVEWTPHIREKYNHQWYQSLENSAAICTCMEVWKIQYNRINRPWTKRSAGESGYHVLPLFLFFFFFEKKWPKTRINVFAFIWVDPGYQEVYLSRPENQLRWIVQASSSWTTQQY